MGIRTHKLSKRFNHDLAFRSEDGRITMILLGPETAPYMRGGLLFSNDGKEFREVWAIAFRGDGPYIKRKISAYDPATGHWRIEKVVSRISLKSKRLTIKALKLYQKVLHRIKTPDEISYTRLPFPSQEYFNQEEVVETIVFRQYGQFVERNYTHLFPRCD